MRFNAFCCFYQIISDIEKKKEERISELKNELKEKLKLCSTEEEKQKVRSNI